MTARRALACAVALALVAACDHEAPFGAGPYGASGPLVPGAPTQLTYSALVDSEPSWLPDGSALVYTASRADFPDTTRCLEFLPPDGGQATRSICPGLGALVDSTRALEEAAVSPAGNLVYLRSARLSPNRGPNSTWATRELVLSSVGRVAGERILATMPIGGALPGHNGAGQIRWLDDDRFVYRADIYYAVFPCPNCRPFDADSSAGFLVLVDTRFDPAAFSVIPQTSGATSVTVIGPDSLLFSAKGDSVVHLNELSTGRVTPFVNFLSGHVVDGVQYAAGRLVVLLDGTLTMVDLSSGVATPIASGYVTPALSPDGKRLVAGYQGDLWLFDLP